MGCEAIRYGGKSVCVISNVLRDHQASYLMCWGFAVQGMQCARGSVCRIPNVLESHPTYSLSNVSAALYLRVFCVCAVSDTPGSWHRVSHGLGVIMQVDRGAHGVMLSIQ